LSVSEVNEAPTKRSTVLLDAQPSSSAPKPVQNHTPDPTRGEDGLTLPERIAILSIYGVQGALGLASLATSFFLKDRLGLGPAEAAELTSFATLPWVIKPVYGFLTDTIPLFGYRRKTYLVLAGLAGQ
jgi:hypothetical protein